MMIRSRSRRWRPAVALVATAVTTVAVLAVQTAPASAAPKVKLPKPYLGKVVTGSHAAPLPAKPVPASSRSTTLTHSASLTAGSWEISTPTGVDALAPRLRTKATRGRTGLPGALLAGPWQSVGASSIKLASAASSATSAVKKVSVRVLSSVQARTAGVSAGLVLELARADGSAALGSTAVEIPNTLLANAYGGGYLGRIRWREVAVPTAGAVSARSMQSAAVVPQTGSTASTGSTVVTPQVSNRAMMLVATSSPVSSTGTGSFAATPLKPASSWQVSAQTGGFAWTYPMSAPPAAAGPTPTLSLNYNSQSVDGETGSTNNQPGQVGDGWDLSDSGSITRSYVPCAQDDGSSGPVPTSGDLCWSTDNATLSLGGLSGQLIAVNSTTWKLQGDNGARVEHLTGAANGCNNSTYDDDCWRVTTANGTQYYFGRNELPGYASGDATTNSVWTVPVFGNDPGEPCHASTFAASSCTQAWQWNLDYVVDPHGNSEAFYYNTESNDYLLNGATLTSYIRGGYLTEIDYGMRAGHEYDADAFSDRVLFTQDPYGRCSDFSSARSTNCTAENGSSETVPANTGDYPDTPWDQYCTAGPCTGNISPTFWSGQMLYAITTQAWSVSAATYQDVNIWQLGHSFPATGDSTNPPSLWLTSLTQTGYQGSASITLPPATFTGQIMQNRVLVVDGLSLMDKYRITGITTDTGEAISIGYSSPVCYGSSDPNCATNLASSIEANPAANTALAYPQWWTPNVSPPQPAQQDLFNKYVVTSIEDDPATGGSTDARVETDYVYTGTPAWTFDTAPGTPDIYRTWDNFAGYNTVEVRHGDHNSPSLQQTTDYTFFQGLNGDPDGPVTSPTSAHRTVNVSATDGSSVPDSPQWAGDVRETVVRNGANGGTGASTTPIVSDTINTPWTSSATASTTYSYSATDTTTTPNTIYSGSFTTSAYLVGTTTSAVSTPASTGTRTVTTTTTYDSTYGLPQTVEVDTPDAGDTCTKTTYAQNASAWLINYPARVLKLGVACSATPSYPASASVSGADVVSDQATIYDGGTLGSAPTRGDATTTEVAVGYSGSTPTWQTTATSSYDALGRVLTMTDPRAPHTGTTSTTSYTPSGSGPLTSQTVTNNLGWTTTTSYNPEWGAVTSQTDQNSEVTTATYDALGRRTGVWLPGRAQASYSSAPSIGYAYTVSTTAPSVVHTTSLVPNGGTKDLYTLYDGMGRVRQTQQAAENGGTLFSDTYYNSTGQVSESVPAYYNNTATPGGTLFTPATTLPGDVRTSYDGAGRTTATIQDVDGAAAWQTSYSYPYADVTDTIPPAGGTPSATYTNSLGKTSKLVQYLSTGLSGTTETTSYGYDPAGDMVKMTNPAGSQWTWTFNVLGQQISDADPGAGTTMSSYYPDGDLQTVTDNRGKATTYSYDTLDRKIGEYDGTSTSAVEVAAWTYDPVVSGAAVLGQPSTSTTYVGGTAGQPGTGTAYTVATTGYNAQYQPTATTYTLPTGAIGGNTAPLSYTTRFGYGADGSQTSQIDPAEGSLPAETETYGYDTLGNINGVAGLSQIVGGIVYTYDNQIAQMAQSHSGIELSRTFYYTDGTDRLKQQLSVSSVSSTNTTVASRTYTYTNNGDLTSASTTATGVATDTQCYSYDYLQDLTAAWTPSSNSCTAAPSSSALGGPAPYWDSYAVDPASGNRSSDIRHAATSTGTDTQDTYSYPAATATPTGTTGGPSAVSSVQHATKPASGSTWTNTTKDNYLYDLDGDTTALPGQTLTYDDQGHLTQTTVGTTSQGDVYTADGDLLLQTDPTTGTTAYLGDTELHAAPGSTTVTGIRTYTAAGETLAERTSSTALYYLDGDQQNTATLEMNAATGAITRRYQDPYGNARGTTPTWSSNFDFLAKPVNTLTQTSSTQTITQIGARNYDATMGRFLTLDPQLDTADPQSINGYTYADNNPTTNTDPSGQHIAMDPGTGCVAAVGCNPTDPPQVIALGTATNSNGGGSGNGGGSSSGGGTGGSSQSSSSSEHCNGSGACYNVAAAAAAAAGPSYCVTLSCLANDLYVVSGAKSVVGCATNPSWGGCAQAVLVVGGAVCTVASDGACAPVAGAADATDAVGDAARVADATDAGTTARDAVGAACGGGSFTPTTEVVMAGGRTLPLDQIKPGDKVEATNTTTGKTTAQTVTKVWVNHDTDLMNVTVTAGGKTSVIQATQHHLFWDATRKAWVEADDLTTGDELRTDDGTIAIVASTVVIPGAADMWDLTVTNDHDFYIVTTSANVLVHNCPVEPRDVHGADRVSSRGIDVQHVVQNGDLYYQDDGQLVRVLDNGNGTSDVVIRDASNPSGQPTSVNRVPNSYVQRKIDSGEWS